MKLVDLVLNVVTQMCRDFMEIILLYLLAVCVMDRSVLFFDAR
jgi:hypothetical protein